MSGIGIIRESGLFIQEILHGIFAIPFAIILWNKTRSIKQVFILFATTYLIDLDHLVDYFSFYGLTFNLKDFFKAEYFISENMFLTPFHAWEWIIILTLLSKVNGWKSIFTSVLFGMLPHVLFDSIIIGHFLSYSILYRIYI